MKLMREDCAAQVKKMDLLVHSEFKAFVAKQEENRFIHLNRMKVTKSSMLFCL